MPITTPPSSHFMELKNHWERKATQEPNGSKFQKRMSTLSKMEDSVATMVSAREAKEARTGIKTRRENYVDEAIDLVTNSQQHILIAENRRDSGDETEALAELKESKIYQKTFQQMFPPR